MIKPWLLAITALALVTQAETIEEWTFSAGSDKSKQGTALGMRWKNPAQLKPGAQKDAYRLTPKEEFFTRLIPLSTPIDCSDKPIVRLEITFSAIDFSADPTSNTHFQVRLQDREADAHVGLQIRDAFRQDKIHAHLFHNLSGKFAFEDTGRLVDSLGPVRETHTVVMELDFKKSQVSVSTSPAWVWSPAGKEGVVVSKLDLSKFTTIDALQNGFRDVNEGDSITVEHIKIEVVD